LPERIHIKQRMALGKAPGEVLYARRVQSPFVSKYDEGTIRLSGVVYRGHSQMFRRKILLAFGLAFLISACSQGGSSRYVAFSLSGNNPRSKVNDPPVCGKSDDEQIHLPREWDSFPAPALGQGYVDPVFGCSVKRLTDSSRDETAWDHKHVAFMNYYSTLTPINASDSMLFVVSDDGNWRIRSVNGGVVIPAAKMPGFSGHPVWDGLDGNVFYYAAKNSLYKAAIDRTSVKSTLLHTFDEYKGIDCPDAADLSQDGDHIALVGQNANNTMDAFVWSLGHQAKTSTYTTTCTIEGNINGAAQPGCLHKLQLTADNLLIIQFLGDGNGAEQGVRLWNGSALVHLQDKTDHYDTGYDLKGKSVFIASNNSATLAGLSNPCAGGWGLDVRQLGNLQSATCLLDHQPYWHVSYRGGPSQPWIALSFFDARKPGPELLSNNPKYEKASTDNWKLYEDEILLAKVDGSSIYRLAHARSRSNENYWGQPHAAISRDGKYVIFTSNMAFSAGCPANMHVAGECSDIYMIKVR
jgi:hypothetical protein